MKPVPVIKDKAGKVGNLDNYRPIALASVVSKVLERILLDRLSSYIVLICFIYLSKAFDRVNHFKLFLKLRQRGVPTYITRILSYWYAIQTMQVKWGEVLSTSFGVGNGVRQSGLLSPALFNIYMNDLSVQLRSCRTGCMVGNTTILCMLMTWPSSLAAVLGFKKC